MILQMRTAMKRLISIDKHLIKKWLFEKMWRKADFDRLAEWAEKYGIKVIPA